MPAKENNLSDQRETADRSRLNHLFSGWAVRVLIAFIISWLLVLAFFASGVVSH